MKQVFSFIMIIALLLFTAGCKQESQTPQGAAFYYCVTTSDYNVGSCALTAEHRADTTDGSLQEVITKYLAGPLSPELESPFPQELKVVGAYQNGQTVYLTFSRELATMTGLDLTIACACMTLTVLSITNAEGVEIRTVAGLLDGQRAIIMDKNTLLLQDTVQEEE